MNLDNNFNQKKNKIEIPKDFVNLGDFLYRLGQMQHRYVHLFPRPGEEDVYLGEGLRYVGDPDDYQKIAMHKDDILIFAERLIDLRNGLGMSNYNKELELKNIQDELKEVLQCD